MRVKSQQSHSRRKRGREGREEGRKGGRKEGRREGGYENERAHLVIRHEPPAGHLRQDKEGHDPTPSQEFQREVVPECDEREHDERRAERVGGAAEWDVEVSVL